MIEANELRIGNKVLFRDGLKGDWHKVVVSGIIGSDKISHHPQIWYSSKMLVGSTNDLECIKPIPLTEEILLKCDCVSFTPDSKEYYEYNIEGIVLRKIKGCSVFYYHADDTFAGVRQSNVAVCISSLHQLQNLYFALAGKELDINP